MCTAHEEIEKTVEKWLKLDKKEETRDEIIKLFKEKNFVELRDRLCKKLQFGTAGVRARMQAGFGYLNDLTIIMLSNGLVEYMKKFYGDNSHGVVIGFDGRHNSERWGYLLARVLVLNGFKTYLFSKMCPTPIVAYATAMLKCGAGVMITASHNPKEDNGFKVYWCNGAQILNPHDEEICKIAYSATELNEKYWSTCDIRADPMFNVPDHVIERYYEEEQQFCCQRSTNQTTLLKFTYSAFCGVGLPYFQRMMECFGFPSSSIVVVESQAIADPEFKGLKFPNPEEGLTVLQQSIETANANNSTIILANDPDADRIQLAERKSNGEWQVFSGNEMGILLTWWKWRVWRESNPTGNASRVHILCSAVSSSFVKTMADNEGFKNELTLTGFKWMGNKAYEHSLNGETVLLCWEESIGFMPGHTRDKDGILAAALFAEIAAYLHAKGLTLNQQLLDIFMQYGFHLMRTSYWFVPDQGVVKNIFQKIRFDYPKEIGPYVVKYVRDLTVGYDSEQANNQPVLPLSKSSEMITFTLTNGSVVTIRASGTEPKLKYYIELKTEPGKEEKDLDDIVLQLAEMEEVVVDALLEPKLNGLLPRPA